MTVFYTVLGLLLLAAVVMLGRAFVSIYVKYHGNSLITCPGNRRPAGVRVDTAHVLWTSLGGSPDLRLNACTRWPQLKDCGQDCLRQIEAAPEECLVRNILTKWYAGKRCALCGKRIGPIQWNEHQPGLLDAEHHTVPWPDVPPQALPEVLETHQPVCWNCHVVNRMRTEHAELVIDRSRHA